MTTEGRTAPSYRTSTDQGPDPVTEAQAITELIQRTTALRSRLLRGTIAASIAGGFGGLALYAALATRFYGRVAGAFFAAGAILTFAAVRRAAHAFARAREAAWQAELVKRHRLSPEPLAEALAMFES